MRVDFKDEIQQAAAICTKPLPHRVRRIVLSDLVIKELGRQRLIIVYGSVGIMQPFKTPDEVEAFDNLYKSLIGTVKAITMKVSGPIAQLVPSAIEIGPHYAELSLYDPTEPEAEGLSTVKQRWFGLKSARLTVIGRGPGTTISGTFYARRKPELQSA